MSKSKIRVLVAEDDEVNAKAARLMLEQLGCLGRRRHRWNGSCGPLS